MKKVGFSPWLIRLRFATIFAYFLLVAAARFLLEIPLPWGSLLAVLGALLTYNILLWASRAWIEQEKPVFLAIELGLDAVALGCLLYFSGGPMNPFSILFVVHIALAAVVLPRSYSLAISALVLGIFALLFWEHRPLVLGHHGGMHGHLQGMWFAFFVSAALIVYFVQRIRGALERAEDLRRRSEKLTTLAWMSGDAAHQLATPLNSILLALNELKRLSQKNGTESLDYLETIESEIERCRRILEQMAVRAGKTVGRRYEDVDLNLLLKNLSAPYVDGPKTVAVSNEIERWYGPAEALLGMLNELLKNAWAAGATTVTVDIECSAGLLVFRVTDNGHGLGEISGADVVEAFYSSHAEGEHFGMGLYLAASACEQLGGHFSIKNGKVCGVVAELHLPEVLDGRY